MGAIIKNGSVVSVCLLLGACSWVDLKPDAQSVQVITEASAKECKLLGTVNAQTKRMIGIYRRTDETLSKELETLARNEAASMEANAIAPIEELTEEGSRKYSVVKCL